jgi:hypothetical protein
MSGETHWLPAPMLLERLGQQHYALGHAGGSFETVARGSDGVGLFGLDDRSADGIGASQDIARCRYGHDYVRLLQPYEHEQ